MKNEVVGRYEVMKSKTLIDMPKCAYDYCFKMIQEKEDNKKNIITKKKRKKIINLSLIL